MDLKSTYKLILGSQSPRRQSLLTSAGFQFETRICTQDEIPNPNIEPEHQAEYLACQKADNLSSELRESELLITADTIVCQNNILLGKPKNRIEAEQFLRQFSGSSHKVITGLCLKSLNKQQSFSTTTKVYFNPISEQDIQNYLNQNTYQDKAGAYGIQETFGLLHVSHIEGCYFNVMGFPVSAFQQVLKQF
ncbi:MAG: Maf family protein [Flavobacteriales bacterium]